MKDFLSLLKTCGFYKGLEEDWIFLKEILNNDREHNKNPLEQFLKKEDQRVIELILSYYLSDKEKESIVLYFGLDRGYERTLNEVGKMFGVTRETIRKRVEKGLRKLRRPNARLTLKHYINSKYVL